MRGRAKSGASRMGLEKRIKRGDGRTGRTGSKTRRKKKAG